MNSTQPLSYQCINMDHFVIQGQTHVLFYFEYSATFGKELLLNKKKEQRNIKWEVKHNR